MQPWLHVISRQRLWDGMLHPWLLHLHKVCFLPDWQRKQSLSALPTWGPAACSSLLQAAD